MNIIAFDVASEVSTFCIMTNSGQIKEMDAIATKITEFKRVIKQVPRPRQIVFEECTQASWLYSELINVCNDVFVCDPRKNRNLSGEFKSDLNDTRELAKRASINALSRVWHGGEDLRNLKAALRFYQQLTQENTRLKNQIKAIFRGNGILIGTQAYNPLTRKKVVTKLKRKIQKEGVLQFGDILDKVAEQRAEAKKRLIKYAAKDKMYKQLKQIDGIGSIFAAMFIAEVGNPNRFRTRSQFYSYAGLAISSYDTAEFEIKGDRITRKERKSHTRGLVRHYNRTLKYMLKQAAMTLSRTKWSKYYKEVKEHSKNSNMAQLTLARKLARVMLHIAKTGENYDVTKVFNVK